MRKYVKIDWPESQRIMVHPEAIFGAESSYMIPEEVWGQYKNTYYEEIK